MTYAYEKCRNQIFYSIFLAKIKQKQNQKHNSEFPEKS
jgi:hypothetical protein